MNELMKKYLLGRPRSKNFVDDLTDALVDVMRFSDQTADYPNIDEVKKDDGVIAEWFYSALNGANDHSELSAILTYTTQEAKFEEIGELMLGIGLTEMKHYGKLSDLIVKLGGRLSQVYTTQPTVYKANTPLEALDNALQTEKTTIENYSRLIERIEKVKETPTTRIALQLISKIVADEELHVRLLQEKKEELTNAAETNL